MPDPVVALQSELGLSCERLNVLERMLTQAESESEQKDYKLVQRRPHDAQQLERLLLKLAASQEFAEMHAAEKRQMQTTIEANRKLAEGAEKCHRAQLQELQDVVEQFKEKLEQLEGERDKLERELQTQQAQAAELHSRDRERNGELRAVREALTEAQQNRQRLSEELEERQQQLCAQKQDTDNLVEQLQQTQQELILEMDQSWSSQLEQLKTELATCQHQFGEEKHKLLNVSLGSTIAALGADDHVVAGSHPCTTARTTPRAEGRVAPAAVGRFATDGSLLVDRRISAAAAGQG